MAGDSPGSVTFYQPLASMGTRGQDGAADRHQENMAAVGILSSSGRV